MLNHLQFSSEGLEVLLSTGWRLGEGGSRGTFLLGTQCGVPEGKDIARCVLLFLGG